MNRTAIAKNNTIENFSPHSNGILQRKCACGQQKQGGAECDNCKNDDSILQRKEKTNGTTQPVASSSLGRSSGQPLAASLAQHFRPSLGPLIDRVRIHNDSSSGGFAHHQNAVAVASGTDIYFARGAYQAGTTAGRHLIAHELAHVHQQHRSNGPPAGYRSTPGDTYEQEADRFAETGHMASDASNVKAKAKPVFQQRTAAEQIATTLRQAADGLGTDEEAIFNALTGRTAVEITDIKAAYLALSSGESLEAMLRDELSRDDLSNALSLLQGETAATETARRLWNAMRGLGTDEDAIYAAVAGRTAAQWTDIQTLYQTMSGNGLLVDLRDELNDGEWQYLQTLLPGATGGAVTEEDRATVIANQLEAAMAGIGTDEEAIYTALTGRTDTELRAIESRFRLLTGFTLDVMLRDELTDSEYDRVRLLLNHDEPLRVAMRLRDAVEGWGTDELEIQAILTGRTPADLTLIHIAYQNEYGESLRDRLNEELSGTEGSTINTLSQQGLLPLEDEIKLAIEGAGTDEERLFAALTEIKSDPSPAARAQAVGNQYAAKGYGNMVEDIVNDLSSSRLEQLWADFLASLDVLLKRESNTRYSTGDNYGLELADTTDLFARSTADPIVPASRFSKSNSRYNDYTWRYRNADRPSERPEYSYDCAAYARSLTMTASGHTGVPRNLWGSSMTITRTLISPSTAPVPGQAYFIEPVTRSGRIAPVNVPVNRPWNNTQVVNKGGTNFHSATVVATDGGDVITSEVNAAYPTQTVPWFNVYRGASGFFNTFEVEYATVDGAGNRHSPRLYSYSAR